MGLELWTMDWRVKSKGESLLAISRLIDEQEAVREDYELAFVLCVQIEKLIILSDDIPDTAKKDMIVQSKLVKESFECLYVGFTHK